MSLFVARSATGGRICGGTDASGGNPACGTARPLLMRFGAAINAIMQATFQLLKPLSLDSSFQQHIGRDVVKIRQRRPATERACQVEVVAPHGLAPVLGGREESGLLHQSGEAARAPDLPCTAILVVVLQRVRGRQEAVGTIKSLEHVLHARGVGTERLH